MAISPGVGLGILGIGSFLQGLVGGRERALDRALKQRALEQEASIAAGRLGLGQGQVKVAEREAETAAGNLLARQRAAELAREKFLAAPGEAKTAFERELILKGTTPGFPTEVGGLSPEAVAALKAAQQQKQESQVRTASGIAAAQAAQKMRVQAARAKLPSPGGADVNLRTAWQALQNAMAAKAALVGRLTGPDVDEAMRDRAIALADEAIAVARDRFEALQQRPAAPAPADLGEGLRSPISDEELMRQLVQGGMTPEDAAAIVSGAR